MRDYFVLIRVCWRLAGEQRGWLALGFALQVVANVILMLAPLITGHIVKTVAEGGPGLMPRIWPWIVAMVAVTVGHFCFQVPARMMERRMAFTLRQRLTDQLYAQVTGLPWAWHQDHHSGSTVNRINFASQAIYSFVDEHIVLIMITVRLLSGVGFLLWASTDSGLVILVTIPMLFLVLRRFNIILQHLSEQQNMGEHELSAGIFDYLGNITTILTLRLQAATRGEILRRFEIIRRPNSRAVDTNETKWALFVTLMQIASATAVLLYLWRHQADPGPLIAGMTAAILQYLGQIDASIRNFADRQQQLMSYRVKVEGIREIEEASATVTPIASNIIQPSWHTCDLRNLGFRYEDQEHKPHLLQDIGLGLKRGKRIALVGESGSGKSTLLRILQGLHEPLAGMLTIDGAIVPILTLSQLSTLVPQDAEIFENTVRYNVTCGIAEQDGLDRAIEMASFESVAASLPNGLDTDIRERGVNLSGGQKQRLALARGLFAARDSSILLLDEPTSSLDPVTEAVVYDRIFAGLPDTCIVSSVHRLHLLSRFDHIYVMDKGRIVEQGSFGELTARDGLLSRMWAAQQREMADGSD